MTRKTNFFKKIPIIFNYGIEIIKNIFGTVNINFFFFIIDFIFSFFFVGLYFAIVNLFLNVRQRPLQRSTDGANSNETDEKKERENKNFSRIFVITFLVTAFCIISLILAPWTERSDINNMVVVC